MTPKAQVTKEKKINGTSSKLKTVVSKDTIRKVKRFMNLNNTRLMRNGHKMPHSMGLLLYETSRTGKSRDRKPTGGLRGRGVATKGAGLP